MLLEAEKLKLSNFNITERASLFSDPEYGALYIKPDDGFTEVDQFTLKQLVKKNQLNPLKGYNKKYLEFYPDEILVEKSFRDLTKAEQFIRNFFQYFDTLSEFYCESIIDKLHKFIAISPSNKSLNCRLELVSSDSCKKFHIDNVHSRLIYTYAGPGTEIKHAVNSETSCIPSGSALIVKGYKYPEFQITTLHRSPPIAQEKIKRLLFIADYV